MSNGSVGPVGCIQVPPRELHEDTYCPRGDMENRIKDCQLDLFANRMSAHAYKADQLRLLLAAFAYVLIDGIRRVALKKTTLAKAVPNTIRLKLLKLGAKRFSPRVDHVLTVDFMTNAGNQNPPKKSMFSGD